MRVGILALLHESNTFSSRPTTRRDFEQEMLLRGEAIRDRMAGAPHEIGGFFEGLAQAEAEHGVSLQAVPLFAARALPSGVVTAEAFDGLLSEMFTALEQAGPLDGLLVAPHGATVSEEHRDADGYWLSQLRQRVGRDVPIISTVDPHANLSQTMVAACDAILAYRSNPHLDQRQRGCGAALLMGRMLRGEARPTMAAAMPPMAINIERQNTSESPCRELLERADADLEEPGVLTNSVILGFPYADVAEMGSSTVVVTDNAPEQARRLADELSGWMWSRRDAFRGNLIGIEEALDRCRQCDGPVCLLDMGDNVGGGSAADGTALAEALHRRGFCDVFVCLYDPEAVQQAEAAGVGTRLSLEMGGKTDNRHGPPWETAVRIVSLHDGRFAESEPRHGGFTSFDQGRTAIVSTEAGMTVMLTSRRMVPFSLNQLRSCGLEPASFRILVAKGVNAPRAAYGEVCRNFLCVNTPGATCADMTALAFRHRRRPMFPFESEARWGEPQESGVAG